MFLINENLVSEDKEPQQQLKEINITNALLFLKDEFHVIAQPKQFHWEAKDSVKAVFIRCFHFTSDFFIRLPPPTKPQLLLCTVCSPRHTIY